MGYHFLENGNGIISCYDMYPTQFSNIRDMTSYLPVLHALGFNSVWINPIQFPGDLTGFFKTDKNNGVKTGNEVTGSLYAMSNPDLLNPLFGAPPEDPSEKAKHLNKEDLQDFTQTARSLGIVPMFDLVLNHLAIDTPLYKQKPHWFKGVHDDFKDVLAFNYEDEAIRKEIIHDLWLPYIRRYMLDYGFDGVRVDAVGYVHREVRQEIYEYIYELAKEAGKPKPVIIDEALFSKRTLEEEVDYLTLPDVGPTHITTEVYNAECNPDGSLPSSVLKDEQLKARVVFNKRDGSLREQVKGGCINFSGNHDYRSLGMTVLFQMAKRRFLADPLYPDLMSHYQQSYSLTEEQLSSITVPNDSFQTSLLYSYVQDIKNELGSNQDTQLEFQALLQEKMALCALSGSGGWFILSGDETSDSTAKTVFQRRNAIDKSYYPQREHRLFAENTDNVNGVLETMAIENFLSENKENDSLLHLYFSLEQCPELQKRFIISHIDNLKHQINAGIPQVYKRFSELLSQKGVVLDSKGDDFLPKSRTAVNGWLGLHNNFEFIRQLNTILKKLPISHPGFSCDRIRLVDKPHLFIMFRKNGASPDAVLDIVIMNLSNEKELLTKEDVQQIARQYCDLYCSKEKSNEAKDFYQSLYKQVFKCIKSNKVHLGHNIAMNGLVFGSPHSLFFAPPGDIPEDKPGFQLSATISNTKV